MCLYGIEQVILAVRMLSWSVYFPLYTNSEGTFCQTILSPICCLVCENPLVPSTYARDQAM